MSYIFGGNTGLTRASAKRRRRAAAFQIAGARPESVGEGIALVGKALAMRNAARRAQKIGSKPTGGGIFGGRGLF